MTDGTRQMAAAAADAAAAEKDVRVLFQKAEETHPEQVLQADGYIFATPENLAAMSGMMKDFFDRCYYAALDRVNGRPYAALVCAGSDGSNAVRQIERIATGWRLKAMADPVIICTQAQTPKTILAKKNIAQDELMRCRELGTSLAAGLAMGIY